MDKRWTLMHGICRTRRAWSDHMRQVAQAEGIPDSYRSVLMFLHHHPGASQKSIAAFLNVTTSAVNQTVKSMAEDGYLRKEADNADKRCIKLYLTSQGQEVADRLHQRLRQSDDAITAFVGAQKEEELMHFLHELTDFIQKELPPCENT